MSLRSSYVVPILDFFVHEGSLFIVMEFYEAGTLRNQIDELRSSNESVAEKVSLFFFFHGFSSLFITECYVDHEVATAIGCRGCEWVERPSRKEDSSPGSEDRECVCDVAGQTEGNRHAHSTRTNIVSLPNTLLITGYPPPKMEGEKKKEEERKKEKERKKEEEEVNEEKNKKKGKEETKRKGKQEEKTGKGERGRRKRRKERETPSLSSFPLRKSLSWGDIFGGNERKEKDTRI
jgi:hypothetical protein